MRIRIAKLQTRDEIQEKKPHNWESSNAPLRDSIGLCFRFVSDWPMPLGLALLEDRRFGWERYGWNLSFSFLSVTSWPDAFCAIIWRCRGSGSVELSFSWGSPRGFCVRSLRNSWRLPGDKNDAIYVCVRYPGEKSMHLYGLVFVETTRGHLRVEVDVRLHSWCNCQLVKLVLSYVCMRYPGE